MWRYLTIFFVLNMIDGAITNYLIAYGYAVDEVNPLLMLTFEHYGWLGFWLYKILVFSVVVGLIFCVFRNPQSQFNIVKSLCIGFGLVVVYMTGLLIYQITCGEPYVP